MLLQMEWIIPLEKTSIPVDQAVLGQNDAFLHVSILFHFSLHLNIFIFPVEYKYTPSVVNVISVKNSFYISFSFGKKIENSFMPSKHQKPKPSFHPIANEQQTSKYSCGEAGVEN